MKRLSLRWKLILFAESLAVIATLVVGTTLDLRAERQLLHAVAKGLATKIEEVVMVLENPDRHLTIEEFLEIETNYQSTPYTYLYQIRDIGGSTLARSKNLQRFILPLPKEWDLTRSERAIDVATVPSSPSRSDDPLVVRTERVDVNMHGLERKTLIIQAAVLLGTWKANLRAEHASDAIDAALILAAMFFLIWLVTTMSLRPVAVITRKAAQISAKNLHDRIPITGRADELDELAKVLNDMLDRLDESMRRTAEFSADAAHQLRTPLTRVQGTLDLMLRREIADPLRGEIEKLHEEVMRLSRLCSRLLLLGRLELHTGEANLMSERVDLKEIAEELVEQCSPAANEHGVTLKLETAVVAHVRGSRILLVEALLNLIDNAIQWTPRGGAVGVAVRANGQEATLSVVDSGPGIADEERERIFQPFYRVAGTSGARTSIGSGLGLAVVRAIARAHEGRAELAPSAGSGCEFRLIVPACPAD